MQFKMKLLALFLVFVLCMTGTAFLPDSVHIPWAVTVLGLFLGILVLRATHVLGTLIRESRKDLRYALSDHEFMHYRQMESLLNLLTVIKPRVPLPWLRHWAASSDFLYQCYCQIIEHKPEVVVELGSGASSVVCAHALSQNGKGRLISLEHESLYGQKTEQNLKEHGLNEFVSIVDAPLVKYDLSGESYWWYDLKSMPAVDAIDFLIVDGPPAGENKEARYPALPLLKQYLKSGSCVLCDDTHRAGEQRILSRWQEMFPDCKVEKVNCHKGAVLLRFV